MTFYFALVDENGVLCVDQIEKSGSEEAVQNIATMYPAVIYFAVESNPPTSEAKR